MNNWIFSEFNYTLNGSTEDMMCNTKKYHNKYEDKLRVFTDSHDDIYWTGNEEEKVLEIHIPGYSKDDVEINVCGNEVTVCWGKESAVEPNNYTYNKVLTGNYTFKIPKYYEFPETAEVKNGIFTMKFKKKQEETFSIEVV